MAEDETRSSVDFPDLIPVKTVAFLSGCYAYATTPSFSGLTGVFAAAVTGLGTSLGTVFTTACGAIGGGLGLGLLAGVSGAVANGVHERRAAARLFDERRAANGGPDERIVIDGETGKIVTFDDDGAKREAEKIAFQHGAGQGGAVFGIAGGIAGLVFGSIGGFLYGVPTSYHLTKDLLVHGTEKRLIQPAPARRPANDNIPAQKLFFDPQKQVGATVQLLTL